MKKGYIIAAIILFAGALMLYLFSAPTWLGPWLGPWLGLAVAIFIFILYERYNKSPPNVDDVDD